MKTYTITCHNVYNYGASLQAYALQSFLHSKGIENTIINYMPEYLSWHYHLSWWVPKRGRHNKVLCNPLIRFLYVIRRYFRDLRYLNRKKAFDDFTNKYLDISDLCTNKKDIECVIKNADVLIAGSDQIWNSANLENGNDDNYYLTFGNSSIKRISYAASFGASMINVEKKQTIATLLKSFDAISVREKTGLRILHELGSSGVQVLDPVFLLDNEQWLRFAQNGMKIPGNYILLYCIGKCNENVLSFAKKISMREGLKIIVIRSNVSVNNFESVANASPIDFVSLIHNASYILSNSFHATAFSIILNKNFYSFSYNEKSSTRIMELLEFLGLADRYNPSTICYLKPIDYSIVNKKLKNKIEDSASWLLNTILL